MNIMKISEDDKEKLYSEMKEFFDKRTNEHIERVKKYARMIENHDPRFKGLVSQANKHDASKFEEPEYTPYLWLTWDYKCKGEGKKFEIPEDIRSKIKPAIDHHFKNNSHHPECGNMSVIDIGEMVADWLAMSDEKNTDPIEWADNNIGKRWKFNQEQTALIYELIKALWNK